LLEVGPDRLVTREVGLDRSSRVIHRMPSKKYRFGQRGFWDVVPVPEGEFTSITQDAWAKTWSLPDEVPSPRMSPASRVRDVLRHWFGRR